MKKTIQSLLQKILGFENYLYYFSMFKISFSNKKTYEKEFFEFMNLIPQGTILDIGANIGITTVLLAKKFPHSRIHSFEPIPANINTLKRIIRHYKFKNVQLHEIALGEEQGELKLVVPVINNVRMQGMSHAYIEGQDDEWNTGDIYIRPLMKLDEVAALKKEQKIAAVKFDVENFEYYVLKGGKQLLHQHRPVIYIELWANEMRQMVIALLEEIGYSIKTYEENRRINSVIHPVTNFIFVHKDNPVPA